ncbi:DsbA family protein [Streptomyces sp. Tu 6176]|uniref:DsbA family protein n=1 Tax=Streptomyces sp. Tu 6176 TaxID=1470557 RepID=UPI00068739B8|nr:thioredoxin domain-containing protein [Streptomyces sp. Tu 6176]
MRGLRDLRGSRGIVIAAAAVLVGTLATGCDKGGDDAARGGDGGNGTGPAATASRAPGATETLAADGTTVRVGSARAKTVVQVYEDLRCPVCKKFETEGGGEALRELVRSGQVRVEYTLASFLDARLGGQGSKKAANALRAALEAGRFAEYHAVLFAHQPEESADGFTDAYLLELASRVKGLRGADFDRAVKDLKYGDYVAASERAFDASGVTGTPTLKVDGKAVPASMNGSLFDKEALPLVIGALSQS